MVNKSAKASDAGPTTRAGDPGSGIFQVTSITLTSGTVYPTDGSDPVITPYANVVFSAVNDATADTSVNGSFTLSTPDIQGFTVGSTYNAVLTIQSSG